MIVVTTVCLVSDKKQCLEFGDKIEVPDALDTADIEELRESNAGMIDNALEYYETNGFMEKKYD